MVTKLKTESQEVRVIDDITCNICGESLLCCEMNYEGLADVRLRGGYGSVLGDEVQYNFSICEVCLRDKVFPLFTVEPEVIDHLWMPAEEDE
jgi:hypothetical protein